MNDAGAGNGQGWMAGFGEIMGGLANGMQQTGQQPQTAESGANSSVTNGPVSFMIGDAPVFNSAAAANSFTDSPWLDFFVFSGIGLAAGYGLSQLKAKKG